MRSLGVILAGGASRRFGSAKALAPVGGVPLVERVRSALEEVPLTAVMIGSAEIARSAGLPFRPDLRPGTGPLGGLETALTMAAELELPGVLAVGCDMPFLPPGLMRRLVSDGEALGLSATAPLADASSVQPLCAWYAVTLLPTVSAMLGAGERSMIQLLRSIDAILIPPAEVARLCDPTRSFLNVNTPADRLAADRLAGRAVR